MPQISPQDIVHICANPNPLVQRALRTLLERLKSVLARHTHITFTTWEVCQKNPPGPRHRIITTVYIQQTPDPQNQNPAPPFIQLMISIQTTGHVHYALLPNTTKSSPIEHFPLNSMEAIDPINQPADTAGFVAHVLDTIRTHIAPLPEVNGYFI